MQLRLRHKHTRSDCKDTELCVFALLSICPVEAHNNRDLLTSSTHCNSSLICSVSGVCHAPQQKFCSSCAPPELLLSLIRLQEERAAPNVSRRRGGERPLDTSRMREKDDDDDDDDDDDVQFSCFAWSSEALHLLDSSQSLWNVKY
ncbi:hypothetical protein DNTS_016950 [Danionella cerebrum]|uniref:Uncharacterized protein n=1 Tax=Danionella cerebrum TaxID=2873325 RepID=A0A553QG12_9TELE|nr:hypothetical protein DNTS_016950 [Danionella translucida]